VPLWHFSLPLRHKGTKSHKKTIKILFIKAL